MSELSRLLQEANDKAPMSARSRADRVSGRLHHGTISAYLRGAHPSAPDEATLQALADAFNLPLGQVQEAAGVQVGAGPYLPPAEAARLTRRQQAAVTEIIMAMVEGSGGQHEDLANSPAEKTGQESGEAALGEKGGDADVHEMPRHTQLRFVEGYIRGYRKQFESGDIPLGELAWRVANLAGMYDREVVQEAIQRQHRRSRDRGTSKLLDPRHEPGASMAPNVNQADVVPAARTAKNQGKALRGQLDELGEEPQE